MPSGPMLINNRPALSSLLPDENNYYRQSLHNQNLNFELSFRSGLLEYKRTLSLLPGGELLSLTPAKLDQLAIHKCGHQEAILDSISLLHKTFLDTKGLQEGFIS